MFMAGISGIIPGTNSVAAGAPAGIDPYWENTVLMLSGDGPNGSTVFTDESFKARGNATVEGGTQVNTALKKFGSGSIDPIGSGEWLSFSDSPDFDFGSGDFTVEAWFAHDDTASDHLISKWTVTGNQLSFALVINSGSVQFFWSTTGADNPNVSTGAVTITLGTFYHVAFSRVGNTGYILFDGVIRNTVDMTGVTIFDSTAPLRIGANGVGSGEFNGQIDEVRITKGVGRYSGAASSSYTVPTAAFPRS